MIDPIYKKAQEKAGIVSGGWLGLSNSLVGYICYGFLGFGVSVFLVSALIIVMNTVATIRLLDYLFLNHETIQAYQRADQGAGLNSESLRSSP